MKKQTTVELCCPKCGLPSKAITGFPCKCIIYICPRCKSNVVYYRNKIETISNRCFYKLLKKGRLSSCGEVSFNKKKTKAQNKKIISEDDILNLRILLETETDSSNIISKL